MRKRRKISSWEDGSREVGREDFGRTVSDDGHVPNLKEGEKREEESAWEEGEGEIRRWKGGRRWLDQTDSTPPPLHLRSFVRSSSNSARPLDIQV